MAIKTEFYRKREDSVRLVRTYSDINHYIEREGVVYSEAIDPEELGRQYTETELEIEETEQIEE